MSNEEPLRWRRCSSCKKDIGFSQIYWVCNVSTCNRKRTGTVFCTVSCWEAHVPIMRHRESWALEKIAPTREEFRREAAATPSPKMRTTPSRPAVEATSRAPQHTVIRRPAPGSGRDAREVRTSAPAVDPAGEALPREILIVASKLKSYIRAASGLNTSDTVLEALSDHVRALCDKAIRSALEHDRKTVMDRDYPDP